MSFVSPLRLLVLLAVPLALAFAIWLARRPARDPVVFTNFEVLAGAIGSPIRRVRRWMPAAFLLAGLIAATTALAVPRVRIQVPEQNGTVVFLVDVSGSMRSSDISPTRLQAAANAMRTFVAHLPKSYKVGLVAFSSQPQVLLEPTTDRKEIDTALTYLQPEAATAIGDGLSAAVQVTKSSLAAAGVKKTPGHKLPAAIVLESDGAQNMGTLSPTQGAELAKRAGIPVDGVALGTPNGTVSYGFGDFATTIPVPPDPAVVARIAQITGGRSYTAQSAGRLSSIYTSLGSSIGREHKWSMVTGWFAAAAAGLMFAAIGLGRIWGSPLP
jgi:Ca-activated chloride channel family protein